MRMTTVKCPVGDCRYEAAQSDPCFGDWAWLHAAVLRHIRKEHPES